jgi:hypothetical protein
MWYDATMFRGLILSTSLTITIALIAIWVRSACSGDLITITRGTNELRLRSDSGRLSAVLITQSQKPAGIMYHSTSPGYHGVWPGRATSECNLLAINFKRGINYEPLLSSFRPAGPCGPFYSVHAYHPLAIALAALPGAVILTRRWQSRTRSSAGLCIQCGYDLRATPDQCPECGAVA